jgi:hypothetical protein
MDAAFGADSGWRSWFSLLIYSGGKTRGFFDSPAGGAAGTGVSAAAFHPVSTSSSCLPAAAKLGAEYAGGNFKLLEQELMGDSLGGRSIVYVGDNLHGDVVLPKQQAGWQTIALVDELAATDSSQCEGQSEAERSSSEWVDWFWCAHPSPCRAACGGGTVGAEAVLTAAAGLTLAFADAMIADVSALAEFYEESGGGGELLSELPPPPPPLCARL